MSLKPLQLRLEAVDKLTKPITKVTRRIEAMRAPVRRLRRSFLDLSRASGLSGLARRLGSVGGLLAGLAKRAALFGAGLAAAGAFAFRRIVQVGDGIAKTASKLGIGVEAFQELAFAASKAGLEQGQFRMGLQRLVRGIGEVRNNLGGESTKIFEALGLDTMIKKGAGTEQVLEALADSLGRFDKQTQVAVAQRIFDSGGVGFLNLFAGGSAAIRESRQELRDLGGVMSKETAAAMEKTSDAMLKLKLRLAGFGFTIAGVVGPTITGLIEKFGKWADANKAIVESKLIDFAKNLSATLEQLPGALSQITTFLKENGPLISQMLKDITGILGFFTSAGGAASKAHLPLQAAIGASRARSEGGSGFFGAVKGAALATPAGLAFQAARQAIGGEVTVRIATEPGSGVRVVGADVNPLAGTRLQVALDELFGNRGHAFTGVLP